MKERTSFGLRIDRNRVPGLPTRKAHEDALTVFVDECAKVFDEAEVRRILSLVTVEWWDRIATQPSTGELNTVVVDGNRVYSGLAVGRMCKVAWRGRLWRSAFCHELLHIVGAEILGVPDLLHCDDTLWKILEPTINRRLSSAQL